MLRCLLVARNENLTGVSTGLTGWSTRPVSISDPGCLNNESWIIADMLLEKKFDFNADIWRKDTYKFLPNVKCDFSFMFYVLHSHLIIVIQCNNSTCDHADPLLFFMFWFIYQFMQFFRWKLTCSYLSLILSYISVHQITKSRIRFQ